MKRERLSDIAGVPTGGRTKNPPHASLSPNGEEDEQGVEGIIIDIQENWRLMYDGVQFQVQERKVRAIGKRIGSSYWKSHAYIRDLDNAICWLGRHRVYMIRDDFPPNSLELLCKTLDEIRDQGMKARELATYQALETIKCYLYSVPPSEPWIADCRVLVDRALGKKV